MSDETIVNKFKEGVEISKVGLDKVDTTDKTYDGRAWFLPMLYNSYRETDLLECCRYASYILEKTCFYNKDIGQFQYLFWEACRSDPKFKETLNKKKQEVLDSMNKKEINEV